MSFGNRKNILDDLYSSVFLLFKKYQPSGNLKFNTLGIFQCLKLRILVEKILPISLKLNFTPNTLGLLWVNMKTARRSYQRRIEGVQVFHIRDQF